MVLVWGRFFVVLTWGPYKRHTDLRSYVSEAKFVKESDFDVKSRLATPKPTEIDEKLKTRKTKKSNFKF